MRIASSSVVTRSKECCIFWESRCCKIVLLVALCNRGLLHYLLLFLSCQMYFSPKLSTSLCLSTHLSRIGPIASLSAREQFAWNPSRLFLKARRRRKSPGSPSRHLSRVHMPVLSSRRAGANTSLFVKDIT